MPPPWSDAKSLAFTAYLRTLPVRYAPGCTCTTCHCARVGFERVYALPPVPATPVCTRVTRAKRATDPRAKAEAQRVLGLRGVA
jgi:hypothetical protein